MRQYHSRKKARLKKSFPLQDQLLISEWFDDSELLSYYGIPLSFFAETLKPADKSGISNILEYVNGTL